MVSIRSNTSASFANWQVDRYSQAVNKSIQKISSGYKINSASDGPGQLGIINRLASTINAWRVGIQATQDTISMLQVADSAMGSDGILGALQAIRDEIVSAGGATLSDSDRQDIQNTINELVDEVDRIATATEFNTRKLLTGDFAAQLTFSNTGVHAYATGKADTATYNLTDIVGASTHQVESTVGPTASAAFSADIDYTATLGSLPSITVNSGAEAGSASYTMVFSSSTVFTVYNDATGDATATGTVGTAFDLNGLNLTVNNDGTFAEDYKITFDMGTGAPPNDIENLAEGNTGDTATATIGGTFDTDAMLNSSFYAEFGFDGGTLKYALYDTEGNQMSDWVTAGDTVTTFDDSRMGSSSITFNVSGATTGDIYEIDFSNFSGIPESEGTFVISSSEGSASISYDGTDRMSEIADRITTAAENVASATASGGELTITSDDPGLEGRLRVYDVSGNFVSQTGLTGVAGTGADAGVTIDGTSYDSATGRFTGVISGIDIVVDDGASLSDATLSVVDSSVTLSSAPSGAPGITFTIRDMTAESLGLTDASGNVQIDVTDGSTDGDLAFIDSIISKVISEQASVGAITNALQFTVDSYGSMQINTQAAYENNYYTDITEETTNLALAQLQLETATAMITQSNLQPQRVMVLLGIVPEGL